MSDQLITVKTAATKTGYTDRTIRSWISDGRIPAYRVGPRGIRIKESDLDDLMRPVPIGE